MNKIVSIITVTYNAESLIEKTIQSIISQNQEFIEYIIIDGGSTDSTLNRINQYRDKISTIVQEPDKGIFDAMNKGIDKATGKWIIFMNAGDVFASNDIIKRISEREYDNETGIIFGSYYWGSLDKLIHPKPFFESRSKIAPMGICHQAMLVRSDLAKRFRFDLNFKVAADYNMANQIFLEGYKFHNLGFPIAIFDTFGFSSKNRIRQLNEVATICKSENTLSYKVKLCILKIKLKIKKILGYDK